MANQVKINDTVFAVGDMIVVHQKIQEEKKMRTQPFEGMVIGIKGRGENKMFTVRKIAIGSIGVERIWPTNSPWIEKIEVKKRGRVRRAKLYYLRKRKGKEALRVKAKKIVHDRVKRGKHHVKRDAKKKPRKPRRKSRPKTSKK